MYTIDAMAEEFLEHLSPRIFEPVGDGAIRNAASSGRADRIASMGFDRDDTR
jgi:hypothetical protein